MTRMSRRVSGFIVVSHIISGSFSPRPLLRLITIFALPMDSTISAFSRSEYANHVFPFAWISYSGDSAI